MTGNRGRNKERCRMQERFLEWLNGSVDDRGPRGYIRVTAEAVELCEQCESEGSIPVEDGIVSICDACGGRIGILSSFKRGRGAEMMSTQLHLHATSSLRRFLGWPAR